MRHKVAELEAKNLDAAVALAEGWRRGNWGLDGFRPDALGWTRPGKVAVGERTEDTEVYELEPWPWSTDWNYGGPLIERCGIDIGGQLARWELGVPKGMEVAKVVSEVRGDSKHVHIVIGPTPLVAAMRAYVASKFGEEIEL